MHYKSLGTHWSLIRELFPGRTENEIKNKFYTTLKRVATRAQLENPKKYTSAFIKCKSNLVQFVDAAILYGRLLPSKRGRKRNIEKALAMKNSLIFPFNSEEKPLPLLPAEDPVASSTARPASHGLISASALQASNYVRPIIVQQIVQPIMMPYCFAIPGIPLGSQTPLLLRNQFDGMYANAMPQNAFMPGTIHGHLQRKLGLVVRLR